jgi:hypothetical protein
MELKPNKRATYILCECCSHPKDEPKLTYDEFHDPDMAWIKFKGEYVITGMYEGDPLPSWLKENPRPYK